MSTAAGIRYPVARVCSRCLGAGKRRVAAVPRPPRISGSGRGTRARSHPAGVCAVALRHAWPAPRGPARDGPTPRPGPSRTVRGCRQVQRPASIRLPLPRSAPSRACHVRACRAIVGGPRAWIGPTRTRLLDAASRSRAGNGRPAPTRRAASVRASRHFGIGAVVAEWRFPFPGRLRRARVQARWWADGRATYHRMSASCACLHGCLGDECAAARTHRIVASVTNEVALVTKRGAARSNSSLARRTRRHMPRP